MAQDCVQSRILVLAVHNTKMIHFRTKFIVVTIKQKAKHGFLTAAMLILLMVKN
jgi:hypothetical protein